MLVVLIVSLALNCFIIGSVVGAVWRFHRPDVGALSPNLLGYASTLPADRRQVVWEGLAPERQKLRPLRREVRAARQATLAALAAEPFNKAEFIAAQARQAQAEDRARAAVQELFGEIAERLTAQERQGYVRWREHRHPRPAISLDEPAHPATPDSAQPK
jgi:uncharacterized membrane protein